MLKDMDATMKQGFERVNNEIKSLNDKVTAISAKVKALERGCNKTVVVDLEKEDEGTKKDKGEEETNGTDGDGTREEKGKEGDGEEEENHSDLFHDFEVVNPGSAMVVVSSPVYVPCEEIVPPNEDDGEEKGADGEEKEADGEEKGADGDDKEASKEEMKDGGEGSEAGMMPRPERVVSKSKYLKTPFRAGLGITENNKKPVGEQVAKPVLEQVGEKRKAAKDANKKTKKSK